MLKNLLNYSPVELAFGTSGLRGLVTDMTDLECYINVFGFISFLQKHDNLVQESTIFVAGDLRKSTPRITQVVLTAIADAGMKAVYGGPVPTPAIAYAASLSTAPCIMVTGSHIPADRNGIKFYKSSGEVLKADEAGIKESVAEVRAHLYKQSAEETPFNHDGTHTQLVEIPEIESDVKDGYVRRYTDVFAKDALANKKVVFYQHSAVGRDIIVTILESLGASVVPVARSDEFISIDTENVTEKETALFRDFVAQNSGSFAVVSTDGDSDRPFVIDETGTFHRGDVLGLVVSKYVGAQFAGVPISANDAVNTFCEANDITLEHTKIGSPYVIVAMQQALRTPTVGWEVNGGFLTGNDIELNGKVLKALPTRDAVLPIICALLAATESNKRVSEIFSELPKRYTGGGLIDDVPQDQIDQFKILSGDKVVMQVLADKVFEGTSFGKARLDVTDGLRLIFESGDVIHLRPSGNAPQFRVYTNADSQERADDLVIQALDESGFISRLLRLLVA